MHTNKGMIKEQMKFCETSSLLKSKTSDGAHVTVSLNDIKGIWRKKKKKKMTAIILRRRLSK